MPKISFTHKESWHVLELLDEAASRSGVSRSQAFDDLLHMGVCALSGGQMEEQYLATVAKHVKGPHGKRGCDSLAAAFAALITVMDRTRADILGDVFQGAISFGQHGQYFTPQNLCDLMAKITLDAVGDSGTEPRTIADPCCGSGRMLLAAADVRPGWELVGQDVDLTCVRMATLNMALRNRYAHVIWGNSLKDERRLVYRTGFNLRGFVREAPLADCSTAVQQAVEAIPQRQADAADPSSAVIDETPEQRGQLYLF